ncbi:ATP synthase subunit gamma, mitochondrial-like [Homalodisca vitripennis]|uniref:ATP synthase subunit gamma, mitochondrial-like n=1 Tax=Homalodisca vitripennis TaxID=197043 RepID=UPI001EECB11D|nr:ATP synthase subunit gamma, mitochondrial-like [Homalodisca vitripennis]KAG8270575.1 ATP synthase subunit gamma, mitochondrial [Homalodisca vitripennis]
MSNLKALSTRLKSVKNIQKITKSMKMVSASKYSRAERELQLARPHGEGTQTFFQRTELIKTEVKQVSDSTNLIIAVTSDKGLCGPVHTQISKAVKAELAKMPGKAKVICIGDKVRLQLQYTYPENISLVVNEIGRLPPNFLDASRIALFTNKHDISGGKIFYNKFESVVSYIVSHIPIFSENDVLNAPKSLMYDSLESDVLDSYLEFSLASKIYYCLKENACSEQASRMSAMDSASKNAGDMIHSLNLVYNRTRQAAITNELIEIISGAAALK